jgi:hypothetical protein
VTEPRRVLIAFDYRADGIWWVATKEEIEAPYEEHRRLNREHHRLTGHRPWGDLLSDQLLDDLKVWNDSWDFTIVRENEEEVPEEVLEERGRALAIRVQDELETDGWEVLYFQGGQAHREAGRTTPGKGTFWATRRQICGSWPRKTPESFESLPAAPEAPTLHESASG